MVGSGAALNSAALGAIQDRWRRVGDWVNQHPLLNRSANADGGPAADGQPLARAVPETDDRCNEAQAVGCTSADKHIEGVDLESKPQ